MIDKILDERYEVYTEIDTDSTIYKLYKAADLDGYNYLAKIWPAKDSNMDYFRALWNSELRKLYRITSSPGVDAGLLTIRDAGYDKLNKSFILVMKSTSEGYDRLSEYMNKRSDVEWLKRDNLTKKEVRISIWRAIGNIAEGIRKLHLQGIFHRNISPDSIFFNPKLEPDSMRLGGFEWSIRLGEQITNLPRTTSSNSIQYSFREDWRAFGFLLLKIFSLSNTKHDIDYLLPAEHEVLNILTRDQEINTFSLLRKIERAVNALRTFGNGSASYLDLIINPKNDNFINKIKDAGFQLDDPSEEFSPVNRNHVASLKRFIQKDLDDGKLLIASATSEGLYILIGKLVNYFIASFESHQTLPWDAAYLLSPTEFRKGDGNDTLTLENARVRVTLASERRQLGREPSVNWKDYLPIFSPSYQGRRLIKKLQNFLRAMNQLELYFRMNEIFTVSVTDYKFENGVDRLTLEEVPPPKRRAVGRIKIPEMCQHFQLEWSSGRPDCNIVILSELKGLKVQSFDQKKWEIERIEPECKQIVIKRQSNGNENFDKGAECYLRTLGHWGQTLLIQRRKHAIQNLDDHAYLLKALSQAGQVYIDTNIEAQLNSSTVETVDKSKVAVIQDVMRTRPIYALQGPPGTGKTTLVAHLVRELIEEDPMVQILITAQAHGAVDVLRKKINKEAFKEESRKPISLRIGSRRSDYKDYDHVEMVSKRILNEAAMEIAAGSDNTELMKKWEQLLSQRNDNNVRFIKDFQELTKRSAIITYSTATSADLATLAEGSDEFDWTFDWSIIEEAGKAHGFDLALPLQTGHRWLLLGDHKQLPPHLFYDFQNMIESLDEVNDELMKLSKQNGATDYVDIDWLREWSNWEENDRDEFKDYSKERLNLFRHIFLSLKDSVFGTEQLTQLMPVGALAGMLTTQYRMHPVIGDMISSVFYDNKIQNGTINENGEPNMEFSTALRFKGCKELDIAIKESPIIWIDVPDALDFKEYADSGNSATEPPYVNHYEIKVLRNFIKGLTSDNETEEISMAILAPYNSQTRLLREVIRTEDIPSFLKPVRNVHARDDSEKKWIHTVDSFQGNEADMVVVSLVRNNPYQHLQKAIGFLAEESRMNVLLSRGRKRLVLIGSFNFFKRQIEHLKDSDDLDPALFLKKLLDFIHIGTSDKKTAIIRSEEIDCLGVE